MFNTLLFVGTTPDEPLYYVNSTRTCAYGPKFLLNFYTLIKTRHLPTDNANGKVSCTSKRMFIIPPKNNWNPPFKFIPIHYIPFVGGGGGGRGLHDGRL